MLTLALMWLSVALGLVSQSVETASSLPMVLLLLEEPIGNNAVLAAGWCVGIGLLAYLWAKRLFNRQPAH